MLTKGDKSTDSEGTLLAAWSAGDTPETKSGNTRITQGSAEWTLLSSHKCEMRALKDIML